MEKDGNLIKRITDLENQMKMIRMDMELFNRKNSKDVKRLEGSICAHRTMLLELKPVYDEFWSKKTEAKKETDRSYG